ncbi:MAG: chemotaxis protein, partial [Alphaproteobacteria bacterium]
MSDLSRLLETFGVDNEILAPLRAERDHIAARIGPLLSHFAERLRAWPELIGPLEKPEVHEARVHHWTRVATAQLDDSFLASAHRLAEVFYRHEIPSQAVAVCHGTVSQALIADLAPYLTERFGAEQANRITEHLMRLIWADLGILLETYSQAEQAGRRAFIQRFAQRFNEELQGIVADVAKASRELQGIAEGLSQGALSASEAASAVAAAAEQATQNVATVAEATRELGKSISEIAGQVSESAHFSEEAVARSEKTMETVNALAQAADDIGEIVTLISKIAGQTNLLALNATIEAARA